MKKLAPVIEIDREKCINCHACISACSVKFCIDGSKDILDINHNLCIGCGHCIAVCTHNARHPVDDMENFSDALKRGEKTIAVVAPAVASVFPEKYLRLNGYLKSLGVEAFFDVSFGAELTVISYLDYINTEKPKIVIAQPCPAIVSFIEIYHPELIPYLAPADSPILHSIKMIKEFYPQYRNHKIVVISPCLAKKREFDDTIGSYNVTMLSLKNQLEKNNLDLSKYPAVDYIGPAAERAVTFPAPGGLLNTLERFKPGIGKVTRKIEGTHTIYNYLETISKLLNKPGVEFPLIIDCLNCEIGCLGGPGTGNHSKPFDELETPVRKRSQELEKQLNPRHTKRLYKKYHNLLKKYWKPDLYKRSYSDISANYTIKEPNEAQLTEVYKSLKKHTEKDIFDCTACGYGSCKKMAVAIFNNLNKVEHCAHYNIALLDEEHEIIKDAKIQVHEQLEEVNRVTKKMQVLAEQLNDYVKAQANSVSKSSSAIEEMVANISSVNRTLVKNSQNVMELEKAAEVGRTSLGGVATDIQVISTQSESLLEINSVMSNIASQTNLLSMNAAIEAAHAGEAGKGFAVVADEIRKLAENSSNQSKTISTVLKNIKGSIDKITNSTNDVLQKFEVMNSSIMTVAEQENNVLKAMEEQGQGGKQVLEGLSDVNKYTSMVEEASRRIAASQTARLSSSNSGKKIVLIIDDDTIHLEITKAVLESHYEVVCVKSGFDALILFSEGLVPNLILLDLIMPDMDGWTTYERVKTIGNLHTVPLAFFTSSDDPKDMEHAQRMGAVDFIQKPINKNELVERIERIIKSVDKNALS